MGKLARKRYWRNWDTIIVPKDTVSQDFKAEVQKWSCENKIPVVVREGSKKLERNPGDPWTSMYEVFWKCHIQHPKNRTLFTMRWL